MTSQSNWPIAKREKNKRVAVKELASVGWTADKIARTIDMDPSTVKSTMAKPSTERKPRENKQWKNSPRMLARLIKFVERTPTLL